MGFIESGAKYLKKIEMVSLVNDDSLYRIHRCDVRGTNLVVPCRRIEPEHLFL
jgi:hypothetical protein